MAITPDPFRGLDIRAALASGRDCRSRGVVFMPSASRGGVRYAVAFDGPNRTCTCAGFVDRGRCRHVQALDAALGRLTS